SIQGTKREVALNGPDGPVMLTVRIPPEVSDNELIEVRCPIPEIGSYENIRARIRITPHQFVERDGNDVIVKVPITISEALHGIEVEIPAIGTSARVKLPPCCGDGKRLRLKGQGLHNDRGQGDLYVCPMIIPPMTVDDASKVAAKAIDRFYTGDVRRDLPKKF